MRPRFVRILLLLVFLPSTTVLAQDISAIEREIAFFVPNEFMGNVLVARQDDILFSGTFGKEDIEQDSPNRLSTVFPIASITKQFTAAAILFMEQRGRLHVDDPINRYLEGIPGELSQITVFHLLSHTSGLPRDIPNTIFRGESAEGPAFDGALLSEINLEFQPGSGSQYSNAGYHLLGEIIEAVSGGNYPAYIQNNILEPLEMDNTGFGLAPANTIKGHSYSDGEVRISDVTQAEFIRPFSAGGMVSTVEDLLTWQTALFKGALLSKSSLEKMTTPVKGSYGLGMEIRFENERRRYSHTGLLPGYASRTAYFPESDLSIVVLSNIYGDGTGLIAQSIEHILYQDSVILPSQRTEIKLPSSTLAKYVGTYSLNGADMKVTMSNEQLVLFRVGDTTPFPLKPMAERVFFSHGPFVHFEFVKGTDNDVSALLVHQRGQVFTLQRQ